jgi:hypothetical protein
MWAATIKPKIDILLNEGDNLRKPLIWSKDRQTTITKYSDNEYAMWTENGIYIINKNYFDESTISIFSKG